MFSPPIGDTKGRHTVRANAARAVVSSLVPTLCFTPARCISRARITLYRGPSLSKSSFQYADPKGHGASEGRLVHVRALRKGDDQLRVLASALGCAGYVFGFFFAFPRFFGSACQLENRSCNGSNDDDHHVMITLPLFVSPDELRSALVIVPTLPDAAGMHTALKSYVFLFSTLAPGTRPHHGPVTS